MKFYKQFTILTLGLLISFSALSQKMLDITGKTIVLKMEGEKGTNANTVIFNNDKDLYYAAYAGNEAYPLETFSDNGQHLHLAKTGQDIRGMWYNSKSENIEANCYNEIGYVTIKTDSKGYAGMGSDVIHAGLNQPSANSCGTIDKKGKVVLFYYDGALISYDRETGERSPNKVYLNVPSALENMNITSLVYTGAKKMEIGLLNFEHKEIYLFNLKSGAHTGTIKLPSTAKTNNRFRFGFANGYAFLYNGETRSWTGYQVFD